MIFIRVQAEAISLEVQGPGTLADASADLSAEPNFDGSGLSKSCGHCGKMVRGRTAAAGLDGIITEG
jgi:hypothetical protein